MARRVEQKENATGAVLNVNISETDILWPHYFRLGRMKSFALPATQEIVPESVFDDFEGAFDSTVPVCGECFRTYCGEVSAA
jgi:hypothetical protein